MASRAGISGLAVALATAGAVLVYTGVHNLPVLDALRELAQGKVPTPAPREPTSVAFTVGSSVGGAAADLAKAGKDWIDSQPTGGARIAAAAQRHIGKPYRWGAAGPDAFDCSGLVSYVLIHDLKMPNVKRMVTTQFLVWTGARTIPNREVAAGDLVCWQGHIGIAVDAERMCHAPHAGSNVQIGKIWRTPVPIIRRVKL